MRKNLLKRSFSASLSIIILCTQVLFAHNPEKNFWEARRQNSREESSGSAVVTQLASAAPLGSGFARGAFASPALPAPSIIRNLEKKAAPARREELALLSDLVARLSQNGSVRDIRLAKNKSAETAPAPVVVYVQDIHGVLEAQKNISAMILNVLAAHPTSGVGLEGAAGRIPIASFRKGSQQVNKQIGSFFLNSGLITGAENAGLASATEPRLFGLETPELYLKNVEAVKTALALQKSELEKVQAAQTQLQLKKPGIYSAALLALDQKWRNYHAGRLNIGDYLAHLSSAGLPPDGWPAVALFQDTWRMEQTIDFDKAERERTRFLSGLVEKLTPQEVSRLMEQSVALHAGMMGYADYYQILKDTAGKAGVDVSKTPEFARYVSYVLQSDAINPQLFLAEFADYEQAVWNRLCVTPEEKELAGGSRKQMLTEKLVSLSLTTEEWAEYKRLAPSGEQAAFESFYDIATARNAAFVSHLKTELAAAPARVTVIVAGGFHSDGIAELLAKEEVTLVTAAPKLTKVEDESGSHYLNAFTREKTPLEKLFEAPKISLVETLSTAPIGNSSRANVMQNLAAMLVVAVGAALATGTGVFKTATQAVAVAAPGSALPNLPGPVVFQAVADDGAQMAAHALSAANIDVSGYLSAVDPVLAFGLFGGVLLAVGILAISMVQSRTAFNRYSDVFFYLSAAGIGISVGFHRYMETGVLLLLPAVLMWFQSGKNERGNKFFGLLFWFLTLISMAGNASGVQAQEAAPDKKPTSNLVAAEENKQNGQPAAQIKAEENEPKVFIIQGTNLSKLEENLLNEAFKIAEKYMPDLEKAATDERVRLSIIASEGDWRGLFEGIKKLGFPLQDEEVKRLLGENFEKGLHGLTIAIADKNYGRGDRPLVLVVFIPHETFKLIEITALGIILHELAHVVQHYESVVLSQRPEMDAEWNEYRANSVVLAILLEMARDPEYRIYLEDLFHPNGYLARLTEAVEFQKEALRKANRSKITKRKEEHKPAAFSKFIFDHGQFMAAITGFMGLLGGIFYLIFRGTHSPENLRGSSNDDMKMKKPKGPSSKILPSVFPFLLLGPIGGFEFGGLMAFAMDPASLAAFAVAIAGGIYLAMRYRKTMTRSEFLGNDKDFRAANSFRQYLRIALLPIAVSLLLIGVFSSFNFAQSTALLGFALDKGFGVEGLFIFSLALGFFGSLIFFRARHGERRTRPPKSPGGPINLSGWLFLLALIAGQSTAQAQGLSVSHSLPEGYAKAEWSRFYSDLFSSVDFSTLGPIFTDFVFIAGLVTMVGLLLAHSYRSYFIENEFSIDSSVHAKVRLLYHLLGLSALAVFLGYFISLQENSLTSASIVVAVLLILMIASLRRFWLNAESGELAYLFVSLVTGFAASAIVLSSPLGFKIVASVVLASSLAYQFFHGAFNQTVSEPMVNMSTPITNPVNTGTNLDTKPPLKIVTGPEENAPGDSSINKEPPTQIEDIDLNSSGMILPFPDKSANRNATPFLIFFGLHQLATHRLDGIMIAEIIFIIAVIALIFQFGRLLHGVIRKSSLREMWAGAIDKVFGDSIKSVNQENGESLIKIKHLIGKAQSLNVETIAGLQAQEADQAINIFLEKKAVAILVDESMMKSMTPKQLEALIRLRTADGKTAWVFTKTQELNLQIQSMALGVPEASVQVFTAAEIFEESEGVEKRISFDELLIQLTHLRKTKPAHALDDVCLVAPAGYTWILRQNDYKIILERLLGSGQLAIIGVSQSAVAALHAAIGA